MSENTLAYGPTGKPQLVAERCASCILRRGGGLVPPGVVRDLISRHRAVGALVTCHETLHWGSHPELGASACRGFYEAYRGENVAALFAERLLGGFDEVSAPTRGHEPPPASGDARPGREVMS
jgi:hypothetical protein